MNNASIHCNRRIEELIISNGCEMLEGMSDVLLIMVVGRHCRRPLGMRL